MSFYSLEQLDGLLDLLAEATLRRLSKIDKPDNPDALESVPAHDDASEQ